MYDLLIDGMIFAGAGLMVYNIYGFLRFAGRVKEQRSWKRSSAVLYIPVILLVLFLLGYLIVGLFGAPDLVMGGILFGGSIFVFVVYRMLNSIVTQVMESERLEAELMAAEQSNRAKTKFLATVSHEMRTPMNVILGLTRIVLLEPELSDVIRDHLEKIDLSARHLLGLINNILELNRIEDGDMSVFKEPFSLRAYIDQVNAMFQTVCEEKGLSYVVTGMEKITAPRYIGDGDMLKHVLLGLLDNAVKYTEAPGHVELLIETVEWESETGGAEEGSLQGFRFSVKDTGIGMDPAFLDRAFETFSQEDGSFTDRYGGSGLGLAVTKRQVELMGGQITVESQKHVGSTFAVTLCLIPAEAEEEPPGPVAESESAQMLDSLEGRRVLIVEDLPANAEIVEDLLELEGAETDHAENGQVGLDMFAASSAGYYDAILMDLRMPVMDGMEATRRIRGLNRLDAETVPIIALTANAAEEDVRECAKAGMNVHLAKPADADQLYDTLKRLIRK